MRISATVVVSMTDIEYKSVFHDEFRDLVSLKQALGFSYVKCILKVTKSCKINSPIWLPFLDHKFMIEPRRFYHDRSLFSAEVKRRI